MEIPTLVRVLDHPHLAADHLHGWGLADVLRGQQILLELADTGLTLDLLASVCKQLGQQLPRTRDPDAALAAFRRYLFAVRSPLSLAALLERDPSAMPMLLAALSLGAPWVELLTDDPEAFDLLRQTDGWPLDGNAVLADFASEVEALQDERAVIETLSRDVRRHLLRIAYSEVVNGEAIGTVFDQLSHLAEATIEAALAAAIRKAQETKSLPTRFDPRAIPSCVIAVGQLG